jgi:hypothetical protein
MKTYAVPHNDAVILVTDDEDVAAIIADHWRKWLRSAGGITSGTYRVSVMVGPFAGTRRDDDGLDGTFTSAGRDYPVIDSVVSA